MKWLKLPLVFIWRVWFYLLVALPIVVFFPLLLVLSSRDKWYPYFFWLARNIWANFILYGMGFIPKIKQHQCFQKGKSTVLVANHSSMADIMLMLKVVSTPFVFLGKKELVRIPIFGFFYRRVCILVDRGNIRSRYAAYEGARKKLDAGLSICIFPEGGVPSEEILLDHFKDGAFRLAVQYNIPIVPIVFYDNKNRFPFKFWKGSPGRMRVKVLSSVMPPIVDNEEKEKVEALKGETRNLIETELRAGPF